MALLSYGEVSSPETFSLKSGEPVKNGLFCERIFGPVRKGKCPCGEDNGEGVAVCRACGVRLSDPAERRRRLGHITLAAPVAHIWYYRGPKNPISRITGLSPGQVLRIVHCELYLVIDPGESGLASNQIISCEAYRNYRVSHKRFCALTGAEAIKALLKNMDPAAMVKELKENSPLSPKQKSRLSALEKLLQSGNKPEWMILDMLPVSPPDLRPVVFLQNGAPAASDLTLLYSKVIYKSQSLKRLMRLGASDIILQNGKKLLQAAVDCLLDNGRSITVKDRSRKRALKSLSDRIRSKRGRIRGNLLAKRVDYSGRASISIGPELKIHQVGVPRIMALELFKPFIFNWLIKKGFAPTLKGARRLLEDGKPEIWDALDEVISEHPVIVNRAPTLHKLSMQAFDPVLVEGASIQLHPLVCSGFNADFDGDTVAVHVPLSLEAQIEARMLMLSINNVFHPANGGLALLPTQDIVLGIYYLTLEEGGRKGEGMVFSDAGEVSIAYENRIVEEHSRIRVRINGSLESTTAGRTLFYAITPAGIPFRAVNKVLAKKDLADLMELCYEVCGMRETVRFLDEIKRIGFQYAMQSGISLCLDDMPVPTEKAAIVESAARSVTAIRMQHGTGLLSDDERYRKVIGIWTEATDRTTSEAIRTMREHPTSLLIMIESGARGDMNQIRQIIGMRGLMAKPAGEIVEVPVTSNFREGLNASEFFLSAHGARKGRVDGPMKTPIAGHFTRRLVSATRDVIVTMDDCGTCEGVYIEPLSNGGLVVLSLKERIVGRVLADNVLDPETCVAIASYGTLIDKNVAARIIDTGVERVKVRSVLTCGAQHGVCAQCYGWNMGNRMLAEKGDAVGIIAAQSIGEPGTQLILRTFHTGGTAAVIPGAIKTMDITGGLPRIIEAFEAKKPAFSGSINPHDLLRTNGIVALWNYMLDEMQKIYRQQAVVIHDKHFEVILRQMTGFVKVTDRGVSRFQDGGIVPRNAFDRECAKARKGGVRPPAAVPVLLGITQIPLFLDSFLASACFQRAAAVLADAALEGRADPLESNAARIITGKRVRAGTGLSG